MPLLASIRVGEVVKENRQERERQKPLFLLDPQYSPILISEIGGIATANGVADELPRLKENQQERCMARVPQPTRGCLLFGQQAREPSYGGVEGGHASKDGGSSTGIKGGGRRSNACGVLQSYDGGHVRIPSNGGGGGRTPHSQI